MTDRRRMIDISEVSALLADRAESLCKYLLPAGVKEGHEYRVGSVAGEKGRSLAVHLGGDRAGVWADFSTGEVGDAMDLVAAVLFRGDKKEAFRWSRAWLGIDGTDPDSIPQTRQKPTARTRDSDGDDDRDQKRIHDSAMRIWLGAHERIAGTMVDRYLRGRGIDLSQLGRQPRTLRYHPKLWNRESNVQWPAMVASIVDHTGRTVGVHRTWLTADIDAGAGRVGKAPLKDAKMTLGRYRGGSIRLWRGKSGKPLGAAPEGDVVAITEGIEDGLTVALARPDLRVLAAVSLPNMQHISLPPQIGRDGGAIVICADNDTNEQAIAALDKALQRFVREGRAVKVARPPAEFKDFNQFLQADRNLPGEGVA